MARRNSPSKPARENMKKALLYPLLFLAFLLPSGCAELKTTVSILNIMMIELFRLPIYVLKIPFQLIQSIGPAIGPAIQSGIRSAANMAPLLLFIERQAPKDTLYAGAAPDMSVEGARHWLTNEAAVPLLPLLGRETEERAQVRFILVDSRLLEDQRLREAILGSLGKEGRRVRCVTVDARDIFSRRERFLQICRRMRERGDSLFALTTFNNELAALTGAAPGDLPSSRADRRFILHWKQLIEEMDADARRKG